MADPIPAAKFAQFDAAMREWLRDNLLIDVQPTNMWVASNDVYIGLRFKGEERAFVYERIDIPPHESV